MSLAKCQDIVAQESNVSRRTDKVYKAALRATCWSFNNYPDTHAGSLLSALLICQPWIQHAERESERRKEKAGKYRKVSQEAAEVCNLLSHL